jgi:ribosome modulation factor
MRKIRTLVFEQPEEYRVGWVHGFYDCANDDGAFWGRRNPGRQENSRIGTEELERLYNEGYRAGVAAR